MARIALYLGPEVAIAAAAVTAAAATATAASTIIQSSAQADAMEAQAKAAREQAARDAADSARATEAKASRQRALLAVMGADLGGQGLSLVQDTMETGALSEARIQADAEAKRAGLRAAASTTRTTGYLSATGQVMSGGARAATLLSR